jgi:hypothetical protein
MTGFDQGSEPGAEKVRDMTGTSWEEERGEVWKSILEAARRADPDRAAACRYLLRHMVASAAPDSRCVRYDERLPVCVRSSRPPLERGGTWEVLPERLPRLSD